LKSITHAGVFARADWRGELVAYMSYFGVPRPSN
jgi:hypothetical protein